MRLHVRPNIRINAHVSCSEFELIEVRANSTRYNCKFILILEFSQILWIHAFKQSDVKSLVCRRLKTFEKCRIILRTLRINFRFSPSILELYYLEKAVILWQYWFCYKSCFLLKSRCLWKLSVSVFKFIKRDLLSCDKTVSSRALKYMCQNPTPFTTSESYFKLR